MASTIVRVYGLRPEDVQVRRATTPDDEIVVYLGDTVAIQGPPREVRDVLCNYLHTKIAEVTLQPAPRIGEPF